MANSELLFSSGVFGIFACPCPIIASEGNDRNKLEADIDESSQNDASRPETHSAGITEVPLSGRKRVEHRSTSDVA